MRRLSLFLLLTLLLPAACTPAVPTLSPEQISTAAAATIAAMATDTPIPTATRVPSPAPTATPLPPALEGAAGHVLVYTGADHDLYAWTSTAGRRSLTTGGGVVDARISADGQWIAYVRAQDSRDYSLWAVRADGSEMRLLFSPDEFMALADDPYTVAVAPDQFEWVPGRHALAFNTRPVYDGPGRLPNNDLWLVDAESGIPQQLLVKKQGGKFYFSPDGHQIAVAQPDSINLMNIDGGSRRELFRYQKVLSYANSQYFVRPAWPADGSYLRVFVPPHDPLSSPAQPAAVWMIPTGGGDPVLNLSLPGAFLWQAELSPDLEWVAYLKAEQVGSEVQFDLHIAAVVGDEDVRYQTNVQSFYGWAPDSRRFVYFTAPGAPPELGEIGAGHAPLTEGPVRLVTWLDEERYVYASYEGNRWGVYLSKPGAAPVLLDQFSGEEQATPVVEVR